MRETKDRMGWDVRSVGAPQRAEEALKDLMRLGDSVLVLYLMFIVFISSGGRAGDWDGWKGGTGN